MKRLNFRHINKLVSTRPALEGGNRAPKPFPGAYPTKVFWLVLYKHVNKPKKDGSIEPVPAHELFKSFHYIGAPCRYRALELHRMTSKQRKLREYYMHWYITAEFDRGGLLAWRANDGASSFSNTYLAYHPQSGGILESVMEAYSKKFYIKKIGKVPTYSFQKVLSQAQIDRFYVWWEATFNNKLKRPVKAAPKKPEPPKAALQQQAANNVRLRIEEPLYAFDFEDDV